METIHEINRSFLTLDPVQYLRYFIRILTLFIYSISSSVSDVSSTSRRIQNPFGNGLVYKKRFGKQSLQLDCRRLGGERPHHDGRLIVRIGGLVGRRVRILGFVWYDQTGVH